MDGRTSSFSRSSQLQTLPLSSPHSQLIPSFTGSTRVGKGQSTHSEEEGKKKPKQQKHPHLNQATPQQQIQKQFLANPSIPPQNHRPWRGQARSPPTAQAIPPAEGNLSPVIHLSTALSPLCLQPASQEEAKEGSSRSEAAFHCSTGPSQSPAEQRCARPRRLQRQSLGPRQN